MTKNFFDRFANSVHFKLVAAGANFTARPNRACLGRGAASQSSGEIIFLLWATQLISY